MAGWIFGLVAVGLVVLVFAGAGDASDAGEPAPWVRVVKLVLGVALLGLAYRGWRARSGERGEQPEPKWMGAVADVTAVKAAGLGVVLSALNPKTIVLTVAAGAAIAQTGIPPAQQATRFSLGSQPSGSVHPWWAHLCSARGRDSRSTAFMTG